MFLSRIKQQQKQQQQQQQQNTLFHPMVITIFIQIKIQIHVDGVLAARNNRKIKNARQPVRRKDAKIEFHTNSPVFKPLPLPTDISEKPHVFSRFPGIIPQG